MSIKTPDHLLFAHTISIPLLLFSFQYILIRLGDISKSIIRATGPTGSSSSSTTKVIRFAGQFVEIEIHIGRFSISWNDDSCAGSYAIRTMSSLRLSNIINR